MEISELYKIYLEHPLVITDTRKLEPGCLFFALKGERFDGNQFALEAVKKGAAYAIIDDSTIVGDQLLLVDDVLKSLQLLANHHRQQMEFPVIGITGSNGKTTTKELMFEVLNSTYKAYATPGNFNNHIGVPLTLLAMPDSTEVAVIEMGANHQGEIAFLSEIAAPSHGLITNIGKAHLEGFGGPEGVKKGKGELFRYLEQNQGIAFVNLDEQHLKEVAGNKLKWIGYLKSDAPSESCPELEVKLLAESPFIKVSFLDQEGNTIICESQLGGKHNFNNIMTAVAIGKYFKVPGEKIAQAISNYLPTNNRSQILDEGSNRFYLDAYNANPTSMTASLKHFSQVEATTKVVILGEMLELGEYSKDEHQKIVEQALGEKYTITAFVGQEFKNCIINHDDILWFPDVSTLKTWYKAKQFENTTFLLKGSRSVGLEKLLN